MHKKRNKKQKLKRQETLLFKLHEHDEKNFFLIKAHDYKKSCALI